MNMLPMSGEPEFDGEHLDRAAYSYFRKEPWIENEGMGYMSEQYASRTFTSFSHTMSDIVNSLSAAGLRVCKLNEYDYDVAYPRYTTERAFHSPTSCWRRRAHEPRRNKGT